MRAQAWASKCNAISVGWSRSDVLALVGPPGLERAFDPVLDPEMAGEAETVLVYHRESLVSNGPTWWFYLRDAQVVHCKRDRGR